MKYIKFILIVIFIIIFSGCSIDYTLVFEDDYFDEYISVNFPNTVENYADIYQNYNPLHYSDDIIYEKDIKKENDNTNVNLHYKYSIDEFQNANSFNNAFFDKNIIITDDFIKIELSKLEGLNVQTDFDIKIKTKNKVVSNNADKVSKNTYIWHVKKDRNKDVRIKIKIKRSLNNEKSSSILGYYIIFGIVIVAIIFILVYYIKKRKSNSF